MVFLWVYGEFFFIGFWWVCGWFLVVDLHWYGFPVECVVASGGWNVMGGKQWVMVGNGGVGWQK